MGNTVVSLFVKGGPVMWPILLCALVVVAVVGERILWWLRQSRLRDHNTLMKIMEALHKGNVGDAVGLSKGSRDPVIQMVYQGLNEHDSCFQVAMQASAGAVLRRAGRFLPVMDTLVTLAPLLGLLGTVTGIMRSFTSIGSCGAGRRQGHRRHRRGADRHRLRPVHRHRLAASVELLRRQGGAVAVRAGDHRLKRRGAAQPHRQPQASVGESRRELSHRGFGRRREPCASNRPLIASTRGSRSSR